jgi:hypothetical protein
MPIRGALYALAITSGLSSVENFIWASWFMWDEITGISGTLPNQFKSLVNAKTVGTLLVHCLNAPSDF